MSVYRTIGPLVIIIKKSQASSQQGKCELINPLSDLSDTGHLAGSNVSYHVGSVTGRCTPQHY